MSYQFHEFSNGIRLVHRRTSSPVAHFGLVVNAGSRDEQPHEQGLAHFIEHMIFKGTMKRNAYQVINRLENVGADLNAFTTKEDTCVYASFLKTHYARVMDLLSDILFNSVFPEKEMVKEKAVVIDEINSYKDSPAEWVHDEFDELLFPAHPLGKNILGTAAFLRKFTQSDLRRFTERLYHTDQLVLSSVGNISFQKIVNLAERYFGQQQASLGNPDRIAPSGYEARKLVKKFGRHQAHIIMGNTAFNIHDKQRIPMALMNNLLGGPAMNSRLNLALREKHGIAYNLESNFQPLSDTGLFSIYLGTDEKMVGKAIDLVHRELAGLREQKLGIVQLRIAKEQLKGQLAITVEASQNEMISIGKSVLVFNKVDTIEEINRKIDKVEALELMSVANDILEPSRLSMLIYNNGRPASADEITGS